jgi:hypothetical protein
MMTFVETENRRQAEFKQTSGYFSPDARADGECLSSFGSPGGTIRLPYLLPLPYAEENLFEGVREGALAYFRENDIAWHGELPGKRPTNHLRDSQICCINFLAPFADNPLALAELLRPLFPSLRRMLPVEDNRFVAFEWIGRENYLGEVVYRRAGRRRGEYVTSADAVVRFEVDGGEIEIVLIEWKYTEINTGEPKLASDKGTNRVLTYAPFYESVACPLDKALLGRFEDLFYDPFYQLMRLQFLAREMERAQELGAAHVRVLRVAPAANVDGDVVSTAAMKRLGSSVSAVWSRLVQPPDRFLSVETERWFGLLLVDRLPELKEWWRYLTGRYAWLAPPRK